MDDLPYARTKAEHTRTLLAKWTFALVMLNAIIQIAYVLSRIF